MGNWQQRWDEQVVPRLTDLVLGLPPVGALRRRAVAGLAGDVLEVGFGSGPNVRFYPPEVRRVLAVEPLDVARERARRRLAGCRTPVEWVGLDGQSLPLEDASVDSVLSTFTLCTIPDVDTALAEIRRVLRPGGEFHFLEHGLASGNRLARWQHRLDPVQQRIAGGCHLSRPIDELVAASGLRILELDRFGWDACYLGRARRVSDAGTGL